MNENYTQPQVQPNVKKGEGEQLASLPQKRNETVLGYLNSKEAALPIRHVIQGRRRVTFFGALRALETRSGR